MTTSQPPLLALVDCNNFYVSCERLFRPDLTGKPVAVLSNNDGCIVARSQEVKDLGIKMGVPLYQVQPLVKQHQITLFSSNYALYADMSARVMAVLEAFAPRLEIYSIDEAFLDLTGVCRNGHPQDARQTPTAYGQQIKQTVLRATGIPVCVGMGPTKTLAKLANHAAKKWPHTHGVLDLSNPRRREKLMRLVPVKEVWGIGPRTALKLNQLGIHTVWELANQPPQAMQAQFNRVVADIVKELNGNACLALDDIAAGKQQIVCSRSFSRRQTDYPALSQAVAEFASRAAEKLRQQHSTARCITVFVRTNPFNPQEPQYQRAASQKLAHGSQDTRRLIAISHHLLAAIFKTGYGYQKCGVQLSHIGPADSPAQADWLGSADSNLPEDNPALMQTLDTINRRFPKSLSIAATGLDQGWQPKAERRSPGYTTDWQGLVKVRC